MYNYAESLEKYFCDADFWYLRLLYCRIHKSIEFLFKIIIMGSKKQEQTNKYINGGWA